MTSSHGGGIPPHKQVLASKSLHTAVETHLAPVKAGAKQATLDRHGWDELLRRTAPAVPTQRGIFNDFFDGEEDKPQGITTQQILLVLDEKI